MQKPLDKHSYHTLQILEHVDKTPLVTNRRVAGKLGVSVKLAHALLGQLVHKGLLHIRKHNSRRWDYFLTPQGIAEKARLTLEFMEFTMQFYREARRRSAEALARIAKAGYCRVAFLGLTEMAEIAYLGVQEQKLELVDVFDDSRAGEDFMGIRIRTLQELQNSPAQRILITAFDPRLPMGRNFLPSGQNGSEIIRDERFVWVFGEDTASTKEDA